MSAGVLNKDQITRILIAGSRIKSTKRVTSKRDPSGVDVPLGDRYYEMPASCRPHAEHYVADLVKKHRGRKHDLTHPTILKKGSVYLVEVDWSLDLPDDICARSTAKSSIGRLDVLVRLLANKHSEFDRVRQGSKTDLFLEVVPLTFDILVAPGKALSQMRFFRGTEKHCTVSREALLYEDPPVLVELSGNRAPLNPVADDENAVLLSLDLTPDRELGFCGFVAKVGVRDSIDPWAKGALDPRVFWEPAPVDDQTVTIERDRFYIFRSKERFRIPPHLAVDCQAYSESLGDIRIHYAGFAHPYFGFDRTEGTPLIFEVRGHSVNTVLRNGDALAKVYFRRMSERAKRDKKQEYNFQELRLSGCFRKWSK